MNWELCPMDALPAAAAVAGPYRKLTAASRRVTTPAQLPLRYPSAADGIALGELVYTTGAASVTGAEATLGQTFDGALAVWSGSWGPVLEACSCIVEWGSHMAGAALTTLPKGMPLIALLAASTPTVAEELLLTVLDALSTFRYPTVTLLLRPESALIAVAEGVGFVVGEEVVVVRITSDE